MAHMTQEHKKEISQKLKKAFGESLKFSLGVKHHSTLIVKILSADVNICEALANIQRKKAALMDSGDFRRDNYLSRAEEFERGEGAKFAHYQVERDLRAIGEDRAAAFFELLFAVINEKNYDRSDSMTDYFDVGFYIECQLGTENKPFQFLA